MFIVIEIHKIDKRPISEAFIGMSNISQMRGTTELYFPARFQELLCNIDNITYTHKDFKNMEIDITFSLEGIVSEENLYKDEEWKLDTLRNFYKILPYQSRIKNPVPVFAICLNKSLRVIDVSQKIDGISRDIDFDQSIDYLGMPKSFPPVEKRSDGVYSFYDKKSTAFYSDLEINKKYEIKIYLESHGSHESGLIFPYSQVKVKSIKQNDESDFNVDSMVSLIYPKIENKIPDWLNSKYTSDDSITRTRMTDSIRMANHFRGDIPVFVPNGDYGVTMDCIHIDGSGLEIPAYGGIRYLTTMIIDHDKDEEIILSVTKNPIPSRVYSQLKNVVGYEGVLAEYDIINFSDQKRRLKIQTELSGLNCIEKKVVYLPKLNSNGSKKPRIIIKQSPNLPVNSLKNFISSQKVSVICSVFDENLGQTLFEETHEVEFLPQDQIIWTSNNLSNSTHYNFYDFIACWVNPNDQGGLLDSVRVGANKYHPEGNLGSSFDFLIEAKSLYEYLQNDLSIQYLNQPFTNQHINDSQRVVLPERVIQNRAGNCIDLTVLFASLLEGIGISTLILITPNHAYLGYGDPNIPNNVICLETTMIGNSSFEDAVAQGEKNYAENFSFAGGIFMLNHLTAFSKGCYAVNLAEARAKGIRSIQN